MDQVMKEKREKGSEKSAFDSAKMYELSKVSRIIIIEHWIFVERKKNWEQQQQQIDVFNQSRVLFARRVCVRVYDDSCLPHQFFNLQIEWKCVVAAENALEFTWYPWQARGKNVSVWIFSPVKSLTLAKQWIEFHWMPSHSYPLPPPSSSAFARTCMIESFGKWLDLDLA